MIDQRVKGKTSRYEEKWHAVPRKGARSDGINGAKRALTCTKEHEALIEAFLRRDPQIAVLVKEHVLGCAPRA